MEIVESFTRSVVTRHNWDNYADGKIRKAVEGVDYVDPDAFRSNIYSQAGRRGMKGETIAGDRFIEFRLVPRG